MPVLRVELVGREASCTKPGRNNNELFYLPNDPGPLQNITDSFFADDTSYNQVSGKRDGLILSRRAHKRVQTTFLHSDQ